MPVVERGVKVQVWGMRGARLPVSPPSQSNPALYGAGSLAPISPLCGLGSSITPDMYVSGLHSSLQCHLAWSFMSFLGQSSHTICQGILVCSCLHKGKRKSKGVKQFPQIAQLLLGHLCFPTSTLIPGHPLMPWEEEGLLQNQR